MLGYWIMDCMTVELMKQVVGFDTSQEAWCMLEKKFVSKSRARMIQHKEELQNFKKKDLKVNGYVLKIKVLCDELESIGCVLSGADKLMYILDGLEETFDNEFSMLTEKCLLRKQLQMMQRI